MIRFDELTRFCLRLLIAAVASFLLFVIVSMLHSMISINPSEKISDRPRSIAVEVVRTPRSQKPVARQRIRQLAPPTHGERSSGSASLASFSPDLSVETGADGGNGVALQQVELAAEIFEEGQTDEDVVPKFTPAATYPQRVQEQGISGTVETVIVIDYQGKVTSVDVVRSPSPLLSTEVRRTLATWRFTPARNKGVPVSIRKRQSIEFNLE